MPRASIILGIVLSLGGLAAGWALPVVPASRALAVLPLNDPRGGVGAGREWSELLRRRLRLVGDLPVVAESRVRRALARRRRYAFSFSADEWRAFAREIGASHVLRGEVRLHEGPPASAVELRLRLFRAGRDLPLYDRTAGARFADDPTDAVLFCCDALVAEMARSMTALFGRPPTPSVTPPSVDPGPPSHPPMPKEPPALAPLPVATTRGLPLPTEKALVGSRLRKAPHVLPPAPPSEKRERRDGPRPTLALQRWKAASDGVGSLDFRSSTDTRPGLLIPLRREGARLALERSSARDGSVGLGESFDLDMDFLDMTFEQDLGLGGLYLGLGASRVSGTLAYELGGLALHRKADALVPRLVAGLRLHGGRGLELDLQVPFSVGELDFGSDGGADYVLDLERPNLTLRLATRF